MIPKAAGIVLRQTEPSIPAGRETGRLAASRTAWLQARGRPAVCPPPRKGQHMFLIFSNRLGCIGSIVVSVVLTLLVLFLLGAV